ncbi:HAD-IC family P-type ATPase [Hamadaea sp.]|uniref:HAD-IC family P-type ATPase n=1 Tax=Hamadaea sp. TaxID=2024425 RepID=UPI0025C40174|nr:HAD-IC family P-type ATPase [Hamadaea sp.]
MSEHSGLTAREVAERNADGRVNRVAGRNSRSVGQIVRANVLTRFNALIGALCALVLVFGSPIDALFGLIIVVNSAVGVIQELRAKQTLDKLALVGRAPVRVRREGKEVEVPPEQVVLDDVVLLATGEKAPVDGEVVDSDHLEIDESLLTGESDPVDKAAGDRVLSGSFAVAGAGAFRATKVGDDAYAAKIASDAGRFSLAHSELYRGINRFLGLLTWVIIPVGALLVIAQFTRGSNVSEAVIGSVAGVVPMIPEGLVLMTSVAFAVGVIRLGRKRCLVQELPAVEVLARVDTLCLDKTGTLTEPGMRLRAIEPMSGQDEGELRTVLAALVQADERPNATLQAVGVAVGDPPSWPVREKQAFSSARKYSGADFDGQGTWLLGAPEVLLDGSSDIQRRVSELATEGLRVLVLVSAPSLSSSDGRSPAALVVLEQKLRAAAPATLKYFGEQDVTVKVISGDNAAAVGAIAGQVGVPGSGNPCDARTLPDGGDELADAVDHHAVFGRVTPQQKREFVGALRGRGHVVAMTGDGVNDALALKEADLGIGMGSGSGATRAVAKVVLLDDDFSVLPSVLGEGRRVLANIERVANLFLTKTAYSILLALAVGVAQLPFPFLPRHVTLVASLTIGIPGFFLALAPSNERARPGFVPRVLRFAIPAGIACAAATFIAYALARANAGTSLEADRSTATLTLFLVAWWVLLLVARPLNGWKIGLLAASAGAFALIASVPPIAKIAALSVTDPGNDTIGVACAAAAAAALTWVVALLRR